MRAYGRDACIRSCALRILEAETISSARVTLRMFCVDLILVLISRPIAMGSRSLCSLGEWGVGNREWSECGFYDSLFPVLDSLPYQLPVFLNSSRAFLKAALVSSSHLPVLTMSAISSPWFWCMKACGDFSNASTWLTGNSSR